MWSLNPDELEVQWKYKTGNGVVALCENPDHDDNHPSMFVDLVEQTFYCFSCGFKGTIDKLIDYTHGYKKWVFNRNLQKDLIDNEWKQFLNNQLAYDDVTLVARDITNNIVEQYDIRHSEKEIIIPLKNTKDEITGVKVRLKNKLKSGVKYLTFGTQPEYICNSKFLISQRQHPIKKRVWVTEGMFGLMKLSHEGVTGLTPLSANRVGGLYNLFKSTPYNNYVLMFDPDYAGYTSVMKMLYDCRGLNNVFAPYKMRDIDCLSSDEIHEYMCCDWSQNYTQSFTRVLHSISLDLGEDSYRKAINLMNKHIDYNMGVGNV